MGESNGGKTPDELISSYLDFNWKGTKATLTGMGYVFYIPDFSPIFGEDEKYGHFVPIEFADKYYDHAIRISGRKDGDIVITPTAADPYLIMRIENFDGHAVATVDGTDVEVFDIDFSLTTLEYPSGKTAVKEKTDYGDYGSNEVYYQDSDPKIYWHGYVGDVGGSFKWVTSDTASAIEEPGYYLAFSLCDWYKDKPVTVEYKEETTATITDWVCRIEDTDTLLNVKYDGKTIIQFNFNKATLLEHE